ncbi:DUF6615 family protein [Aquimarina muelleri]|uniref:DUF6615 family protein n=1 Tax=Aquimarina muelleri TaxID=279356 RepID=UPI003F685387
MNNTITEGIQKLYIGKDISEILDMISINVWDRIAFARSRKGFKIYETTITQDILYQLALASEVSKHGVKLFEAKSEKTNGNDIECYVKVNDGFMFFPMQAKLMYSDNSYAQIAHRRGKIDQIDLLVDYAKCKKGYPLYLLYNGFPGSMRLDKLTQSYNQTKSYGVSFTSAIHIKKNFQNKYGRIKGDPIWRIPTFQDLHTKFSRPFPALANLSNYPLNAHEVIEQKLRFHPVDYDIAVYSKEELLEDNSWVDLTPDNGLISKPDKNTVTEPVVDCINHTSISNKFGYKHASENEFKPKFRLILSNNDNLD